jgi:hypothetical protein
MISRSLLLHRHSRDPWPASSVGLVQQGRDVILREMALGPPRTPKPPLPFHSRNRDPPAASCPHTHTHTDTPCMSPRRRKKCGSGEISWAAFPRAWGRRCLFAHHPSHHIHIGRSQYSTYHSTVHSDIKIHQARQSHMDNRIISFRSRDFAWARAESPGQHVLLPCRR